MKTFLTFIEERVPVRPDTLVGRTLGPKWDHRVRVEVDFHGEWKSVGEFHDLQQAEPSIRRFKWAGYRVRARRVDHGLAPVREAVGDQPQPQEVQQRFLQVFGRHFQPAQQGTSDVNFKGMGWRAWASATVGDRTLAATMEYDNVRVGSPPVPVVTIDFYNADKSRDAMWIPKQMRAGTMDFLRALQRLAADLAAAGFVIHYTAIERKENLYQKALLQSGLKPVGPGYWAK